MSFTPLGEPLMAALYFHNNEDNSGGGCSSQGTKSSLASALMHRKPPAHSPGAQIQNLQSHNLVLAGMIVVELEHTPPPMPHIPQISLFSSYTSRCHAEAKTIDYLA